MKKILNQYLINVVVRSVERNVLCLCHILPKIVSWGTFLGYQG